MSAHKIKKALNWQSDNSGLSKTFYQLRFTSTFKLTNYVDIFKGK